MFVTNKFTSQINFDQRAIFSCFKEHFTRKRHDIALNDFTSSPRLNSHMTHFIKKNTLLYIFRLIHL